MAKIFGAAFHGKLSKLRKYLQAEDDTLLDCPSVDWADEQGTTALHAACQEGCTDCVELLLRAGAMAGRATAGGTTPLMLACENGRADCAELLLKAQADVSATDGEHRATALHGASQAGSPACVVLLLSHGANVDAADSEGATPLAIAAHRGHAHCVELLFNAGADDGARFDGKTALQLAEEAGHAACAALLNGGGEGGGGDEGGEDDEAVIGPPRPPPTAANKLLSGLSSQLKQSGLGGADVIAEKEKELAEQVRSARTCISMHISSASACAHTYEHPRAHMPRERSRDGVRDAAADAISGGGDQGAGGRGRQEEGY